MKEVIFSRHGEAVPDFEAEHYAYRLLEQDTLHISNEVVLNFIRCMVKEGAINVADIKFTYVDPYDGTTHNLVCYPDGRFQNWPRGLCDDNMNALSRLLK